MKRLSYIVLISVLFLSVTEAQTRAVREKVKADKQSSHTSQRSASSSSAPSWEPDFEDAGLAEMIVGALVYVTGYAVYKGLWHGQHVVMDKRDKYPELVSLQGTLASGFNFGDSGWMMESGVQGNYGVFASHLRFLNVKDVTGRIQSIDWQVLKLRVPISSFRLEYGIGFSHFISPSKTYFDSSLGFEGDLFKKNLHLQGIYRWSQNTNLGDRYRQEYTIDAAVQVAKLGALRLYPFVGYSHFSYFESIDFNYFRLGVKLRIFR